MCRYQEDVTARGAAGKNGLRWATVRASIEEIGRLARYTGASAAIRRLLADDLAILESRERRQNVRLRNIIMSNVDVRRLHADGVQVHGIVGSLRVRDSGAMRNAIVQGADFGLDAENLDMVLAHVTESPRFTTRLSGGTIEGGRFIGVGMEHSEWSGVSAPGLRIEASNLQSVRMEDNDLSFATFATIDGSRLDRAILRKNSLLGATMRQSSGESMTLEGNNLSSADLVRLMVGLQAIARTRRARRGDSRRLWSASTERRAQRRDHSRARHPTPQHRRVLLPRRRTPDRTSRRLAAARLVEPRGRLPRATARRTPIGRSLAVVRDVAIWMTANGLLHCTRPGGAERPRRAVSADLRVADAVLDRAVPAPPRNCHSKSSETVSP